RKTVRGCGSKVSTATGRLSLRAMSRTWPSSTAWPRCKPSKLPIARTEPREGFEPGPGCRMTRITEVGGLIRGRWREKSPSGGPRVGSRGSASFAITAECLAGPPLRLMRKIVGKRHPPVLRFLPDRSRGWREAAVTERADGDADMVGPQIGLPKHRRPASRAEM